MKLEVNKSLPIEENGWDFLATFTVASCWPLVHVPAQELYAALAGNASNPNMIHHARQLVINTTSTASHLKEYEIGDSLMLRNSREGNRAPQIPGVIKNGRLLRRRKLIFKV